MAGSDLDAGIGALQKLTDIMRNLPFWLLIGLTVASSVLWKSPDFPVPVPPMLRNWLPASAFTLGLITFCKLAGELGSMWLVRHRTALARDRMRLDNVYRPLVALFLTCHVTACEGILAPYFRSRLQNAWNVLAHHRPWPNAVKAFKALFDRRCSTSAEIEFGGSYPLRDILSITRNHITIADKKLLNLVRRADRSRYEEPGDSSLLTDEEFELFEHIQHEHDQLILRTRWVAINS